MATLEFNQLLVNNAEFLKPFAITLTRDSEAAKDLFQETLYRALANKDKYNVGTNIKAWLFTIMRNIFINNYRRNAKRNTVTDTSDNQYLLNSTKKVEKNDSERAFMAEDIDKAMEEVSKDFTEPFMMYYRGFKYQEIAEKLDLP